MKQHIYSCKGRHFKVYNTELELVLEHPSDTETVDLAFYGSEEYLIIEVTNYIQTGMRIANQKIRTDIYIMQETFKPLLDMLTLYLDWFEVESNEFAKTWKFSSPVARDGRQGVPNLVKLSEIPNIIVYAPFGGQELIFKNSTMIIDSQVPSKYQTKWIREGAARQIHIGIFGGRANNYRNIKENNVVQVLIPIEDIRNSFINPIKNNWVTNCLNDTFKYMI